MTGRARSFWYLKQTARFCVDYRKVNAVSKFDAYPMPRVDELFYRLGTTRIYSTLDLTKGYCQIPLSKEKTTFTMPFGLHQFVTLRLGCSGRPPPFSVSWTKSSDHTPHMPLPIWMTLSSTVRTGSGICCTCGRY